jgi:hypothetical protein
MKLKGIAVCVLSLTPVLLGRPSSGQTLNNNTAPQTMPALACPGVPSDAAFISSVSVVWAIQQGNQVRLVFSNQPISCAAALGGAGAQHGFSSELAGLSEATCTDSWINEFSVANAQPGVFDLSVVGIGPAESKTRVEQLQLGFGCAASTECRVTSMVSGGSAPAQVPVGDSASTAPVGIPAPVSAGPDAMLEIFSNNEVCLSGRLSDYIPRPSVPPPPDMNGVFVAQWCTAS